MLSEFGASDARFPPFSCPGGVASSGSGQRSNGSMTSVEAFMYWIVWIITVSYLALNGATTSILLWL